MIRYNELGLKSPPVRSRFQKRMIRNIEDKFLAEDLDCFIEPDWGRIYLQTSDTKRGIELLRTIFGLTSLSPVITTDSEIDNISRTTVDYARAILSSNQSFALRTRRVGTHNYTSMSLAEHVGREILKELSELELSVNLTKPDVELFIEVRRKSAYIFSEKINGPGGLPLGTQGKIICIFSDPLSYIASWLMMKRGCRIYPVEFLNDSASNESITIDHMHQLEILRPWAANLKLQSFEIANNVNGQKEKGNEKINDLLNLGLHDEGFKNYLERTGAKAVCLSIDLHGLTLLSNPNLLNVPIFYPLIGLDKKHITNLEAKIKSAK